MFQPIHIYVVDMDTNEPGIVSTKGKMDIHRRKLPIPKVSYTQREPIKLYNIFENTPEITPDEAIRRAEKSIETQTKKAQKNATKELKHERSSLEKIGKREQESDKKKRLEETPKNAKND